MKAYLFGRLNCVKANKKLVQARVKYILDLRMNKEVAWETK